MLAPETKLADASWGREEGSGSYGSDRLARIGVQAERSEFIEEPGRRPQSGRTKTLRAKGACRYRVQAAGLHVSGAGAR